MPQWKGYHGLAALTSLCVALAGYHLAYGHPATGAGFACNAVIGAAVALFAWTKGK